uniref:Uncharacterized protein n=1 Tax=Ixodes ricinus TaxID=34613 RepID=A0A6B0V479_IXORI
MLCCSATLAPGTCLGPAAPLSCQHSSAHWASPVAPSGCPLEMSPPLGLTTYFPPYVLSPRSTNSPALPTGQSPRASYVISSLAEKQSCSSTTCTSSGVSPALRKASWAAFWVMSKPTILMQLFSLNADGKSVDISRLRISTACPSSLRRRTTSSLTSNAAAAPSDVGQHWSLVSGPNTVGDSRISCKVCSSWNCELGLFTEWRWFFSAILARCSGVVPYLAMCSMPAAPNI